MNFTTVVKATYHQVPASSSMFVDDFRFRRAARYAPQAYHYCLSRRADNKPDRSSDKAVAFPEMFSRKAIIACATRYGLRKTGQRLEKYVSS